MQPLCVLNCSLVADRLAVMTTNSSLRPTRKRSQTRAERQEATRQKLFEAAARQVGSDGYAGASIQKITSMADIANGTFYNYFESQQDLFDQLLPELGENLLQSIGDAISGKTSGLAREEAAFRAFFHYLTANPGFYRVLNEAETFAPKAYASHMENMATRYLRALRHEAAKGELAPFSERELEVIVYILLSARNYLAYRYTIRNGKSGRLPDWVVSAYMKFVGGGLNAGRGGRRPAKLDQAPLRPQDRYQLRTASDGSSLVAMAVPDALLDAYGSIEHGAIAGLVERAAVAACAGEGVEARVTNVSVSFVTPSFARQLVARGRRTGEVGPIMHAAVTVFEAGKKGNSVVSDVAVASGLAVVSTAAVT